ncbi:MAG: hypothetical protein KJ556_18575 [Gammaproteobacteria bacterium]|nr:hypothetical protein [Gammaproteobacteria bacterium]MBU2058835.1 hypothetical protein [Gammaproteobacteria bacterium]MBU2177102.1 hypothetical protein [Gammaproteobacteria bacterium]MBU2247088.1 hypothetical protein [Gammaproteobacteria bacterium]MBU2342967.1 hypothetical protein [Gammaproteobacteria bacterium]
MKTNKTTAVAVSALVLGSLSTLSLTAHANPFSAEQLNAGYQLASAEASCGADKAKDKEAKCGEGKCGEDKAKDKEAKCGEGKCGGDKKDGKDKEKTKEAKCGEGKCGGAV